MTNTLHPGKILNRKVIQPLDITPYRLAQLLNVQQPKIHGIINGKRKITENTALRLERLLGTPALEWIMLQASYDLDKARKKLQKSINSTVQPLCKSHRRVASIRKNQK
jgi:antitoxin HigA-1